MSNNVFGVWEVAKSPPSEYFKMILCSSECWNWRWMAAKISSNVPVFDCSTAPFAIFPVILPIISVLPLHRLLPPWVCLLPNPSVGIGVGWQPKIPSSAPVFNCPAAPFAIVPVILQTIQSLCFLRCRLLTPWVYMLPNLSVGI